MFACIHSLAAKSLTIFLVSVYLLATLLLGIGQYSILFGPPHDRELCSPFFCVEYTDGQHEEYDRDEINRSRNMKYYTLSSVDRLSMFRIMRADCTEQKSDDFANGCVCLSCRNSQLTTANSVFNSECCVVIKTGIYVGQTQKLLLDGGLVSNQISGRGTFSFAKGDELTGKIFIGNFLKGLRNGFGVLVVNDVVIFRGHWLNDKRHGYGVSFSRIGVCVHKGEWLKGKRCTKQNKMKRKTLS